MGTSSSQRSPATPEWDRVRELYVEGARDPAEISRRIVAALPLDVRTQMSGPGVATCLDTLLQAASAGPDVLARQAGMPPGHSAAATARAVAERRIAMEGWASRFSDLALDALGSCLVEAMAPAADLALSAALGASCAGTAAHGAPGGSPLLGCFMRSDIERCFGYFVSRDISEFVGVPALPDVAAADAAVRRVADWCRSVAATVPYGTIEGIVPGYWQLDIGPRVQRLLPPLACMMQTGLEAIATRGTDRP